MKKIFFIILLFFILFFLCSCSTQNTNIYGLNINQYHKEELTGVDIKIITYKVIEYKNRTHEVIVYSNIEDVYIIRETFLFKGTYKKENLIFYNFEIFDKEKKS